MPAGEPKHRKNPSGWTGHMIPNSAIISESESSRPPTLEELNTASSKARWLIGHYRGLFYIPNGEFLEMVRYPHHLDYRLAGPKRSSHDFYVVSRSPGWRRVPVGSTSHWSVYCQGHFYHLSAPNLPRESLHKSQHVSRYGDVRCQLRHEDASSPDTNDYQRLTNYANKKPLIAYKVGQTDYLPDQLLNLAEQIISQLSVYSLFSANCQHFARAMAVRSVMRLSDRSAFVGMPTQIVDWDFRNKDDPYINCIERGFMTTRPRPINSGIIQDALWLLFPKLRGDIKAYRVTILYEKGPTAAGSWNSHGDLRSDLRNLKKCVKAIGPVSRELMFQQEDLASRRWRDALLGRRQEQPDGTMRRPLQRKSPSEHLPMARFAVAT